MKKFLSVISAALMLALLLSACGNEKKALDEAAPDAAGAKLKIVTNVFPQYDFAKKVGGDKVEVSMLLKPGAESHSYEPSPKDIEEIRNADLFIYVGSPNEFWVEKVLDGIDGKKPELLRLVDAVELLEEEIVEGMEHAHDHDHEADDAHEHDHEADDAHDHDHEADDAHDHDHEADDAHEHNHEADDAHDHDHEADDTHEHDHEMDEHVWTSPVNAIKIVQEIKEKLIEKDPANKDYYEKNAAAYIKELETLDREIRELVSKAKRKTILFGDRFPFRYFAEEYGLKYYAAFTGCSTESEADASTIVFLEKKVKEEGLPVVFTIELSNGKIADAICEDTGAKKLVFHSCHNLTKDEVASGEDYLSIMKKNLKHLEEALN